MRDLRAAVAAQPDYPPLLFVVQGQASDAAAFFGDYWPEARAVADPDLTIYRAFGLHRGSIRQLMNPGVVACSLRAAAKGNVQGRTVGDAYQMPGLFLLQGEHILWQKDYAHAGDSPDWSALPGTLPLVAEGTENR